MRGDGSSDAADRDEIHSLRDLSPYQWKSGIAAWLGWLFDGLDMHLYVLVAAPFVAELVGVTDTRNERVGWYSSWIQAAFLVGWALGGGFFGRVGDLIGRSRALSLTILTYAMFTGLAYFAQTWWQLLIVRFLAALGIGGEWAVGASLLVGDVAAPLAAMDRRRAPERCQYRHPAGLVCDVRAGGEEPPRGLLGRSGAGPAGILDPPQRPRDRRMGQAKRQAKDAAPGIAQLFRGEIRRTAIPHDPGLLGDSDGALGVHVLVSAAPAKPAGRDQHGTGAEE